MYNSVIFDVDGTLLDGTEGIIKSVKYAIDEMNLSQITEEQLISFVGPPVQNSAKNIFNLNDNDAQEFANIFRKQYAVGDVFLAKVYDGIYDLLGYLKEKNIKMGVATYKREDYAIDLMKHFGFDKYFDSICGADNENKLKKIDVLQNCINNLSKNREDVIMIGDSCHDAEASQKLGVSFIGVTYGFGFKNSDEIIKYKPIFVAKNIYEILKYFTGNIRNLQ